MNAPETMPPCSSVSANAPLAPWLAQLHLEFSRNALATRLTRREHFGPLRVQKALYPEGPQVCHAIVLHPPGGVAGGDQLEIQAQLHEGAQALLTTPGAAKWYKGSAEQIARQTVRLSLARNAKLEWLPQESIVFDAAHVRWSLRVDLAPGARYTGWEIISLGRLASSERFQLGRLQLATEIWRDGQPLWLERGGIEGGSPLLEAASGLGGDPVWGSLVMAGADIPTEWLQRLRALPVAPQLRLGVSALPGVLLVRALGPAVEPVRALLQQCWLQLRMAFMQVPAQVPRIWAT